MTPVVDGVTGGAQDAVQALVNLGYSFSVADTAVRAVLEDGIPDSTEEFVRRALSATRTYSNLIVNTLGRITSDLSGLSYSVVTEQLGDIGLECSVYVLHKVLDFGEIPV